MASHPLTRPRHSEALGQHFDKDTHHNLDRGHLAPSWPGPLRVRYTLASKLVYELVEAADDKQLSNTIGRYGRAELLFQVLTEREERSAIAIASNGPFSGWTKTSTDPRLLNGCDARPAGDIVSSPTPRNPPPRPATAWWQQHVVITGA